MEVWIIWTPICGFPQHSGLARSGEGPHSVIKKDSLHQRENYVTLESPIALHIKQFVEFATYIKDYRLGEENTSDKMTY